MAATREPAEGFENGKATLTETFEISTFMGTKLDSPRSYDATWYEYESEAAAKTAEKWPKDVSQFVLDAVNVAQKGNARSAGAAKATADLREKLMADPVYQREQLIKNVMAGNKKLTRARAEAIADSILSQG